MTSLLFTLILASSPLDAAREAYQSGRVEESRKMLEQLLYPLRLDDPAMECEARFLLAASWFALGDQNRAEEEVVRAWGASAVQELDSLLYPPDFVAFASAVKGRNAARIAALVSQRAPPIPEPAPASKLSDSDAPRREAPEPAPPPKPIEIGVAPRERISPVMAFVPFGAPQFQENHLGRGTLLAAGQATCLVAAVGGLSGALALRGPDGLYSRADAEIARPLNYAWVAGAWCFLGLYGYGIVDGLINR